MYRTQGQVLILAGDMSVLRPLYRKIDSSSSDAQENCAAFKTKQLLVLRPLELVGIRSCIGIVQLETSA